ncbi:hypothetical protein [Bdellovibrio bacteriovorus]|uniref:hypothetical protein n=1 Tax=Bdellovibrio bacteriovorus TaxID=959 RepID=UPI003AA85B9B
MKNIIKVYLILFILSFASFAKAEGKRSQWGFGYAALAAHYFSQEYSDLMPNKVDSNGYLVRLPTYFAVSYKWDDGKDRLAQIAYFKNCYLDPSLSLTYAEKLEEYSPDWMDIRVGGVLYLRQLPKDDSGRSIQDFWGEIQAGGTGFWLMPAVIFSVQVTDHWWLDLGLSGVAIGQLRFTF